MQKRICCHCGINITTNTWKTHLQIRCKLSQNDINIIKNILDLKTKHYHAWFIPDGKEAKADPKWFLSILEQNTSLTDWRFSSPRKRGENPPSICKRNSESRIGSRNPACKSKNFLFSKQEVINFLKIEVQKIDENTDLNYSALNKILNKKFYNYRYLLTDEINCKLGLTTALLHLAQPELKLIDIKNKIKARRGLHISKGLKNSPRAISTASKMAASLNSRWRITYPEKVLLNMILGLDNKASKQYKLSDNDKWFSYDIYSPSINALIEMHGHVWHILNENTPDKLRDLVIKNVLNDKIKENLAIKLGFRYITLFDNEMNQWDEQLEKIYGRKTTVNLQNAKDKVC